jgi:hypothetical protein
MHHKRKGPKSTRSGCLLCKPHKRQGAPRTVKVKGQPGRSCLRRPFLQLAYEDVDAGRTAAVATARR